MKAEYDFSKGERGKFHRPNACLRMPVYLDAEVQRAVENVAKEQGSDLSTVVNEILRAGMISARPSE